MTEKGWNARYFCTGESANYVIGCVGDTKSLIGWLQLCFPDYDQEYIKGYFKDDPPGYVVKYILESKKIRLVKSW